MFASDEGWRSMTQALSTKRVVAFVHVTHVTHMHVDKYTNTDYAYQGMYTVLAIVSVAEWQ